MDVEPLGRKVGSVSHIVFKHPVEGAIFMAGGL